ncbi:MAG: zinc ribbon domain-containing protein, partial [Desulfobacterales bacterium]
IHQDATEAELLEVAQWAGMTTLLEDALSKVKAGITTFEEVIRVLGVQNSVDIQCPHCDAHLDEWFRFCPFCGDAVRLRCDKCNRSMATAWNNCPHCGQAQQSQDNTAVSDGGTKAA